MATSLTLRLIIRAGVVHKYHWGVCWFTKQEFSSFTHLLNKLVRMRLDLKLVRLAEFVLSLLLSSEEVFLSWLLILLSRSLVFVRVELKVICIMLMSLIFLSRSAILSSSRATIVSLSLVIKAVTLMGSWGCVVLFCSCWTASLSSRYAKSKCCDWNENRSCN